MPKTTRIGFIGSGGIAGFHMGNLAKVDGVELAAFNDAMHDRALERANQYGGKAYKSAKTMVEKADLDGVYVCVPPHCHGRTERTVCDAELPIFIEKPVTNNLRLAERIAQSIADAKILNSVGYNWRYMDITEKAQQLLKGKTVGMVLGYWIGGMPMVPWWRRMEESGGQLVEQCTHIVDVARYLCGEITKVYAAASLRSMKDVERTNVPDVTTMTAEFKSGAIGTINTACLAQQGGVVALHIITRGTTLELSDRQLIVRESGHIETFNSAVSGHAEADKTFIAAIRAKKQSLIRSSYADAVKTLAVTLAGNRSFQTGRSVTI